MIKSILTAAVLTIGLAGYAAAQETTTGAPAGKIPETQEPPPMHHTFTITTICTITFITCTT